MTSPSTGLKNIVFSSYKHFTSMVDQLGEVQKGFSITEQDLVWHPIWICRQIDF